MMPNRKRRSSRRSSILKGSSPREVLSEVETNVEETTTIRKSRRVSFAATYMVKEFIKDSPKPPVVDNCDVPAVPGLPGVPVGLSTDPVIDNGNQTQWGDVTMDMTETITPGVIEGPCFTADPSPIVKVDSHSLLQRISGLKSNFTPRNLSEHGIQPQTIQANETVTGDAFGMELTQCVVTNQDNSIFPESRTGKSFAEKTVIFQDENACDMSVTMCQPPLNMSTIKPIKPPPSNPLLVTQSLLSKLSAFKKTPSNPVWDQTRLHTSGDDSAVMEMTCLPGSTSYAGGLPRSVNAEESNEQEEGLPSCLPPQELSRVSAIGRVSPHKENNNDCISLSNETEAGYSISSMDLTCTTDKLSEKRRVSFAPIISTAFVLNDTASTVSSEQGAPIECLTPKLTGFGNKSLILNSTGDVTGVENGESPEALEPTPNPQAGFSTKSAMLVTSALLSKLTGASKPKSGFSANTLLSKLAEKSNKTVVSSLENNMEMTGVGENTGILSSKPTGVPNKTVVFSAENEMDITQVTGSTGVLSSKATGVGNKTTVFSSENDMDMTDVLGHSSTLPFKHTNVADKTTLFSSENDMEMTQTVQVTGALSSKPTGLANKTTVLSSENDMEMTQTVGITGILSSKPTGVANKTTVFSSENDMEMTQTVQVTGALSSKTTGLANKTTVFSSENDMEMTQTVGITGILSSKPTGVANKTTLFSSENDMEMTQTVLSSKPTGVSNITTVFSSENDMEMTQTVLSSKPTGMDNKTTVFSSENDMEMTPTVLSTKPTGVANKTTVFSSENDMEMTQTVLSSKPTSLANKTTVFSSENDMEMTQTFLSSKPTGVANKTTVFSSENDMEMTQTVLSSKPTSMANKTTVFSSENDMEMTRFDGNTDIIPSKPTGMPNRTTLFSSENDMEMTHVDGNVHNLSSKTTGMLNKHILLPSGNDKDSQHTKEDFRAVSNEFSNNFTTEVLNNSLNDEEDDEVTFKLPSTSDETLPTGNEKHVNVDNEEHGNVQTGVLHFSDSCERERKEEKDNADTDEQMNTDLPMASTGHAQDNETARGSADVSRKSDESHPRSSSSCVGELFTKLHSLQSGNDAVSSMEKSGAEREENIADVSLELVEITGDQQDLIKDSVVPEQQDVKNTSVATKHSYSNSVSHISDLADASSIMPKTTQGVSFSAIDDMSMVSDITSFDDFLSIFRIILYDPVGRGNSLCPPPVEDGDSLAEKLKLIYCMEPELQLTEEGNQHLIGLLAEHENVFRAREAQILPDLVEAIKDEDTKKKTQGFLQKIHKICYEQARCDVKSLRLEMAQEVKRTLKEKCDKLEVDIKLLEEIPEKLQRFHEDKDNLKQAMECLNRLREVKSKGDSLEEQAAKGAEKEEELRAQIETLKAELETMPSPGKPMRDLKNQLFRLRESVSWKLIAFGPCGATFSWLGGLVQLCLKFGDPVPDCLDQRFVTEKSLKCNLQGNAKCFDRLAVNLMTECSILSGVTCETTKHIPQLLDALSDIASSIETIRKDLASVEWFHDIKNDDNCGVLLSISEYKTVSKVKIAVKYDPNHLHHPAYISAEPLFGNIRKDQLLSAVQGIEPGPGFFKQLTETIETILLQCPSLMDV